MKSSKEESSSPPPVPAKQLPTLQPRPSALQQQQPLTNSSLARTNSMSKSMVVPPNDSSSPVTHNESIHESLQSKISMAASSYGLVTSKDETNNSSENLTSPSQPPPVLLRTGKTALGPRVLPTIDPNGEGPPVKLRPLASEKKGKSKFSFIYILNFVFSCPSSYRK